MVEIVIAFRKKWLVVMQFLMTLKVESMFHLDDLKHMTNHICRNLNNWTPNYRFQYNMYSYSSKAYIVCRWRQSKGLSPIAKWVEAICGNNLVNLFEDSNHKNCSCGSVYYKQFIFYNYLQKMSVTVEKFSKQMTSANAYDIKIPYFPSYVAGSFLPKFLSYFAAYFVF